MDTTAEPQETGPDGYVYPLNHPRYALHQILSNAMQESLHIFTDNIISIQPSQEDPNCDDGASRHATQLEYLQAYIKRSDMESVAQKKFLLDAVQSLPLNSTENMDFALQAVFERLGWCNSIRRNREVRIDNSTNSRNMALWRYLCFIELARKLLRSELSASRSYLEELLLSIVSDFEPGEMNIQFNSMLTWIPDDELFPKLEELYNGHDLPEFIRQALEKIRIVQFHLIRVGYEQSEKSSDPILISINKILSGEYEYIFYGGEAWADAAREDIAKMPQDVRENWIELLLHARNSDATKPSKKWLTQAEQAIAKIGREQFKQRVLSWFPLAQKQTFTSLLELNSATLKGLVWCCSLFDGTDMSVAIGDLALTAYKKIPGIGARAMKVGNACVHTLGAMPGMASISQLTRLRQRVKYQVAQSLIEKTLEAAAIRANLPTEDLEELAVPTFGLDENGVLSETLGAYEAVINLTSNTNAELAFFEGGIPLKNVPGAIKSEHAEVWKQLKKTTDEINKVISPQRDRIERILLSDRSWSFADWRQRYLDHPLLGHFARQLIWCFEEEGKSELGIWQECRIVDQANQAIAWQTDTTRVRLWHPIHSDPDVVLSWRKWLEKYERKQPFKQAHREIYILTDAEKGNQYLFQQVRGPFN